MVILVWFLVHTLTFILFIRKAHKRLIKINIYMSGITYWWALSVMYCVLSVPIVMAIGRDNIEIQRVALLMILTVVADYISGEALFKEVKKRENKYGITGKLH